MLLCCLAMADSSDENPCFNSESDSDQGRETSTISRDNSFFRTEARKRKRTNINSAPVHGEVVSDEEQSDFSMNVDDEEGEADSHQYTNHENVASDEELKDNDVDDEMSKLTPAQWISIYNLHIKNFNPECQSDVMEIFDLYFRFFCNIPEEGSDIFKRYSLLFESPQIMNTVFDNINAKIAALLRKVCQLDPSNSSEFQRKMCEVGQKLLMGFKMLLNFYSIQNYHNSAISSDLLARQGLTEYVAEELTDEMKNEKWVILYYLSLARERALKRKQGPEGSKNVRVYAPVYGELVRQTNGRSCTYTVWLNSYAPITKKDGVNDPVPVSLSDFVNYSVYPVTSNQQLFDKLITGKVRKNVIETLSEISHEFWDWLSTNPYLQAYCNGVYDTSRNVFHHFLASDAERSMCGVHISELKGYNEREKHDYGTIASVTFSQNSFDCDVYERQMMDEAKNRNTPNDGLNFMGIKTPITDAIFNEQGFSREEQAFIWVCVGRIFFPVNYLDDWQICPWFIGLANTGKSTILKFVMSCFEFEDVGILSNNCQTKFALAGKNLLRAMFVMDSNTKFGMSQTDLQSITSGEPVEHNRKHQGTEQVKAWKTTLMGAGNSLPVGDNNDKGNLNVNQWDDSAGQITRRIVTFPMETAVDPDRLRADLSRVFENTERPAFMKKSITAYLLYAKKYPIIKKIIPERFKLPNVFGKDHGPLEEFLSACCDLGDNNMCSVTDFQDAYNRFLREKRRTNINADVCGMLRFQLMRHKITVTRGVFDEDFNARMLTGVKLKDSCQ